MRPDSPESLWTALALGALEPGDALALLRAGGAGAPLRLATHQLLLGVPGAPVAPLRAWAGPADLMGAASPPGGPVPRLAPGERLRLRLQPEGPAEELRPLLLLRIGDAVERLLPDARGRWPTLDAFPLDEEGARVIDLVVGGAPGPRAALVALLSADAVREAWPAGDPREARAWQAVAEGTLCGAELRFDVG
jgi:hypothetical protein